MDAHIVILVVIVVVVFGMGGLWVVRQFLLPKPIWVRQIICANISYDLIESYDLILNIHLVKMSCFYGIGVKVNNNTGILFGAIETNVQL